MAFDVGERLSYNGELCTVRFIGELPAWPSEQAIGVEWDNVSNGKHDGSYKGISYFKTLNESSGSFLKASKKHDGVNCFHQALIDTYGTPVDDQEIKIGKKYVEIYGFDKLQLLQSDFTYLTNISLSRKQINGLKYGAKDFVTNGLINLKELDLSFNLFNDLDDVLEITSILNLESLNLTGNRFGKSSSHFTSTIKNLNISLTQISNQILDQIPHIFVRLEKLYLQENSFRSFDADISTLDTLKLLDLSSNLLTSIPTVISASKIITLNISDNQIELDNSNSKFLSIESLDIRRNQLRTWNEINFLQESFPNVQNLRINGNPFSEDLSSEEADYQVIARWPRLNSLNGVEITDYERINAELYFISEVIAGRVSYDDQKLAFLSKKHGRKFMTKSKQNEDLTFDTIDLIIKDGDVVRGLVLLKSIEVLRLRGILSRLLNKSVLDFNISYSNGNFKETLSNDLAFLTSFNFENGQVLTIEKRTD